MNRLIVGLILLASLALAHTIVGDSVPPTTTSNEQASLLWDSIYLLKANTRLATMRLNMRLDSIMGDSIHKAREQRANIMAGCCVGMVAAVPIYAVLFALLYGVAGSK